MNYRILKIKNDIELFLKENIEHQNKHIDYILFNPKTNDTYVLASDNYDDAIEFTPYTKTEVVVIHKYQNGIITLITIFIIIWKKD